MGRERYTHHTASIDGGQVMFELLFRMLVPYYAPPITRDQLGNLPARPWADPFRPPPFDPAADIQQGGTGERPDREAPNE